MENTHIQNGSLVFSAYVTYAQPGYEELQRRYPTDLNPEYNGARFRPSVGLENISFDDREVSFEYVYSSESDVSDPEILAVMRLRGLRPATYEELLSSDEKRSDKQFKGWTIALGSEAIVRRSRVVAILCHDDWQGLEMYSNRDENGYNTWRAEDWNGKRRTYRFLAVRE